MLKIDVNIISGGLKLNNDFSVDFSTLNDGPFLAHVIFYLKIIFFRKCVTKMGIVLQIFGFKKYIQQTLI